MRVRGAGRQYEVIRGIAQSAQIENDDVRCLVIVQCGRSNTKVAEYIRSTGGSVVRLRGNLSLGVRWFLVFYLIEYTPCTGADVDTDRRGYIIQKTCPRRIA